jgi:hypothetical protein
VPSPKLVPFNLADDGRLSLTAWSRRRKTAQTLALGSRIVLACAEGGTIGSVAAELGVSRDMVSKWRARFVADRLEVLTDEPRPGRPQLIRMSMWSRVITATLEPFVWTEIADENAGTLAAYCSRINGRARTLV